MSRFRLFVCALLAGLAAALAGAGAAKVLHGPARLAVRAAPAGAAVFVDDAFLGHAAAAPLPTEGLALAPGYHVVRVAAPGHGTVRRRVNLPRYPADTTVVDVRLEPVAVARARIVSDPPGALVMSGGLSLGRTPLTLPNLEPGRHSFTVALDNHLPATVAAVLAPGESNPDLEVKLTDRQVAMYEARIAEDPSNIQNYNDFGEYLYTQDRKDEAAAVYAEGYYRLGRTGGMERLNEALQKAGRSSDKPFMDAFDAAVARMISSGKHSPRLWDMFQQGSRRHPDDPRYTEAFANLARNTTDPRVLEQFLARALAGKKLEGVLPALEHWLELPIDKIAGYAKLLGHLGQVAELARELEQPEVVESCLKLAEVAAVRAAGMRAFAGDALWPRARAVFALQLGRHADHRRHLEAAALAQMDQLYSNRWRLELAEAWLNEAGRVKDDDARLALAWAGRHAGYIVRRDRRVDPAKEGARKLLERLEKDHQIKIPASWPATLPLDDWQVAGPFPAAAAPAPGIIDIDQTAAAFAASPGPGDSLEISGVKHDVAWSRVNTLLDPAAEVLPAAGRRGGGIHVARGWFWSQLPREAVLKVTVPGPARLLVQGREEWRTDEAATEAEVPLRLPHGYLELSLVWDARPAPDKGWRIELTGTGQAGETAPLNDLFWTAGRE